MVGKLYGNRYMMNITLSPSASQKLEKLMQAEHLNKSNTVERAIHFKYDHLTAVKTKTEK